MAAHATANPLPALDALDALDAGGIERRIARLMPAFLLGMVAILGVAWWLAAQPPPGPGWGIRMDRSSNGRRTSTRSRISVAARSTRRRRRRTADVRCARATA